MAARPFTPATAILVVTMDAQGRITHISAIPLSGDEDLSTIEYTIVLDEEDPDQYSATGYADKIFGSPILQPSDADETSDGTSGQSDNESALRLVQIMVVRWALFFLTVALGSAVIRWLLTPSVDISAYLRSGVLTPAALALAAAVAWSYRTSKKQLEGRNPSKESDSILG